MAVNTECQEAVLLLLEHGADIDAVVSAIGPGAGPRGAGGGANGAGLGWERARMGGVGLEESKGIEMLDPAVRMRAAGCLGSARRRLKPSRPAAGH